MSAISATSSMVQQFVLAYSSTSSMLLDALGRRGVDHIGKNTTHQTPFVWGISHGKTFSSHFPFPSLDLSCYFCSLSLGWAFLITTGTTQAHARQTWAYITYRGCAIEADGRKRENWDSILQFVMHGLFKSHDPQKSLTSSLTSHKKEFLGCSHYILFSISDSFILGVHMDLS